MVSWTAHGPALRVRWRQHDTCVNTPAPGNQEEENKSWRCLSYSLGRRRRRIRSKLGCVIFTSLLAMPVETYDPNMSELFLLEVVIHRNTIIDDASSELTDFVCFTSSILRVNRLIYRPDNMRYTIVNTVTTVEHWKRVKMVFKAALVICLVCLHCWLLCHKFYMTLFCCCKHKGFTKASPHTALSFAHINSHTVSTFFLTLIFVYSCF